MLFNSIEFIFLFLPISFTAYFYLNKKFLQRYDSLWLSICSFIFYGWWDFRYVFLIFFSIIINYFFSYLIFNHNKKRVSFTSGIIFNLTLLGYYKYTNFFLNNLNILTGTNFEIREIILPLGISFFTFHQISFLCDSYQNKIERSGFLDYTAFVTFFPQLIAGPIVRAKEMLPQFKDPQKRIMNPENIAKGIYIFTIGLLKKVVIADKLATYVNVGYANTEGISLLCAWALTFLYSLQLYFDFSGYIDMAIGTGFMFNIELPKNFDSPYKAGNLQKFWNSWNISLSRFLKDYVYIPLGGSRKGDLRTYINLLVTFLLCGLWHGAGWNFIFWGLLHGIGLVIHRIWKNLGLRLNYITGWFITFNYINISWIFFRASNWKDAINVLRGMLGLNGFAIFDKILSKWPTLAKYGFRNDGVFGNLFASTSSNMNSTIELAIWFISVFCITLLPSSLNTNNLVANFKPDAHRLLFTILLITIILTRFHSASEFLYFNF